MADGDQTQSLRRSLGDALATPPLRRLQIAWAASAVANWAFFVALSVYAYRHGGATAVALAALVQGLPAGLLAPIAGVLADRRSRRDVMTATTLGRAIALVVTAAAVYAGAPLAVVIGLGGLFTVIGVPHKPAQAALLPTIAETPRQLAAANAVWNAIDSAGFLVGSLLGGLLIAGPGAKAAFAAMAAVFVLATVLLLRIERDPVPEHRRQEEDTTPMREAVLGFREIASNSGTRLLVLMLTAAALIEGALDVLVVVIALEVLSLGDSGVGVMNAAWGLGGLVGGVATLTLLARGRLAEGLVAGGVIVGGSLAAVAAIPVPAVAALLLASVGIGFALVEVSGSTLLQRLTPDEVLGRVFAAVESSFHIAAAVGAMIAPAVVSLFGNRGALVAVGAFLPLLVLVRLAALNRFETAVEIPERPYRLLRGLPLFAPLPLATVETVALRAREMRVPAGGVVIREGEPGEAFYAIAEGSLDPACEAGAFPRMHEGDFFGEIALLREIPRTATVTACTECVLYEIGREAFLTSVTGQRRSIGAAQTVADTRLGRTPLTPGEGERTPAG
jgi:MFS family permease